MDETKNIISYIYNYKDVSIKEKPFNELDALIFAQLAYFPMDKIKQKRIYSAKYLSKLLNGYVSENQQKRKLLDLELFKFIIQTKRFKNIKVGFYKKDKSAEAEKQFAAMTFFHRDFVYVAFCGTDASIVGWKEDFNLSFMETIPSDISALEYLTNIYKKVPFRDIYVGGHSKGGRLTIYACKNLEENKKIKGIYDFDGPGFMENFYDDKYENIKGRVHKFIPSESIIGRLIYDDKTATVIESNAKLLMQHDPYTWIVDDDKFYYASGPTKQSEKIVHSINRMIENLSNEDKMIFIDTFYELLTSINVKELKDSEYNKSIMWDVLKEFRVSWKTFDKEKKRRMRGLLFAAMGIVISEYYFKK